MNSPTSPTVATSVPRRGAVSYRGDIDGLRAIAIVVVVAFHAHVTGFSGGFIGVDVFFVISGWLITNQLLESTHGGKAPQLRNFWARRIRRLVPASALMISSTLVLSLALLSPLDWGHIAQRAAAAATYTSNLLFAWRGGDYFSGPLQTSPFLHTWSLGVEEQFYLVWPLVFLVCVRGIRRRPSQGSATRLIVAMCVIAVVSFGLNLTLTKTASLWSFYSLPTRAWEFAVAGLAVALLRHRSAWPPWFRMAAATTGMLLVAAAVVLFSESTPYPGTAAVVPVVGTLLLLIAGHGLVGPDQKAPFGVLERPSMRYLGRLSYSWYLWHWPFIILAVDVTYQDTTAMRLGAALAALAVAAATHALVENPLRFSTSLQRSLVRTYALGAVLTLACLALAGGLARLATRELDQSPYRELEAARQSYHFYDCVQQVSTAGVGYCEAGDTSSDRTVMLLGDSHAGQWMTAFSNAAKDLGLRVVLRNSGNCSATTVGDSDLQAGRAACARFQAQSADLIEQMRPSAVVLADAIRSRDLAFPGGPDDWRTATESQLRDLGRHGVRFGLIIDNPSSDDPILCIARGHSRSFCTPSREEAFAGLDRYASATRGLLGAFEEPVPHLDVNDRICSARKCRIQRRGDWIFGSFEHLTENFTTSQEQSVRAFLGELTAAREG